MALLRVVNEVILSSDDVYTHHMYHIESIQWVLFLHGAYSNTLDMWKFYWGPVFALEDIHSFKWLQSFGGWLTWNSTDVVNVCQSVHMLRIIFRVDNPIFLWFCCDSLWLVNIISCCLIYIMLMSSFHKCTGIWEINIEAIKNSLLVLFFRFSLPNW